MNAVAQPPILHASAVAFGANSGILIVGPSGAGKSTLALSLIEMGAQLVADDRTLIASVGPALFARAPRAIEGLIEVRGVGVIRLLPRRLARIRLVIDLAQAEGRRMPPPETCTIAGVELPLRRQSPGRPFLLAIRHSIMTFESMS